MAKQVSKINTGEFITHKRKKKRDNPKIIKVVVCALIIMAIGTIAFLDGPVSSRLKESLTAALTFEIDVDETLGQLKFVQENDSHVQDVMSTGDVAMDFTLPVKDSAIKSANTGDYTMMLEATALTDIVAPAGGVVENVDDYEVFEITLDHGFETKSVIKFSGAMAVLNEGDTLNKGEYMGLVDQGEVVEFRVIKDGQNVDPANYLV